MQIIHQNNQLIITLLTASPAALHFSLAIAIINTLKQQMQSGQPIPKNVQESNVYLLQLLETLMPDERQLEELNDPVDIATTPN